MISFYANGQLGGPLRKNAIMMEYSHLGMYSVNSITINYERTFVQKGAINYYIRAGIGEWGGPWKERDGYFGPKINVGIGAFLGKRSHYLDVQAGPETYIATGGNEESQYQNPLGPAFHAFALAGYRYQEPGRPLLFKVAVASYGLCTVMFGTSF